MQLEMFPDRLHLRRIDPTRQMRRFYEIAVQRELHRDEGQAMDRLIARARAKARRGYRQP